jgi:hypothetical protein
LITEKIFLKGHESDYIPPIGGIFNLNLVYL